MKLCKAPDCGQEKTKKSMYCETHFNRPLCIFDGCKHKSKAGEPLCNAHTENRNRFNLTVEEFLTYKSKKVCELCGLEMPLLYIDHDHDHCPAGAGCKECIRGMLCKSCNSGLGYFKDNPILLLKAIGYLKRVRPGHFKDHT